MTAPWPDRLDAPAALAPWSAPAAAGRPSGMRLTLRRAWPRTAGHVLLEYRGGAGGLVAGQWFADGARLSAVARATAAGGGGVAVAGGQTLLQAAGADRRLTGLAGLLACPGAVLVSHRPERRAVVRTPSGDAVRYAKVMRPDRVDRTVWIARRVGALAGFATPELLASDPTRGVTVWSPLPGTSLHDLLPGDRLVGAAGRAGQALRGLHAAALGPLPLHTAADEGDVLAMWLSRLRAHHPEAAQALEVPARDVVRRLRGLPPAPAAPVHRDWYDKQVFVADDGTVGMLDFDTVALGDPAIDLANALVHLELRSLQGRCPREVAGAAAEALLAGYGPDPRVVGVLPAYAAAARVRLACVYRFRPRWTGLAAGLIERAADPFAAGLP